jgi:serine O-acetyltransferase
LPRESEFRLLGFLAADLRRHYAASRGHDNVPHPTRLWLGLFSPRFVPVLLCRLAYWNYSHGLGPVAKLLSLFNFFFFGIEIASRCSIGRGLILPHTQGTVIGAWSIGENATIFQGVTLGARELDFSYRPSSRPVLGDSVTVGAGAKVLGGISVGSDVQIGANAVVLHSLPSHIVAVGIPAKIVRSRNEES